MKKTFLLITCLAGSQAMAVLSEAQLAAPHAITLGENATSVDMTSVLSQNSTSQSFTAVLTLDVNALSVFGVGKSTNDAKKTPIISWTIGSDAHTCNISVNNNSDGDRKITTAGFYHEYTDNANCALPSDTGAAATLFSTNGNDAASALSSIDWANAVAGALTLTYNGLSASTGPLGTQIYFSVKMNDGSIKTMNAANTGLRWTSPGNNVTAIGYDPTYLDALTIYEGYATAEQAWELNKEVVPEPTTATLSLLALAGLAARRRRK